MSNTFLTKEGYQKLIEELQRLKNQQLPSVLERLKEAIAQGDISENAEYDTAMGEKDLILARISEIEIAIQNVEIIEQDTTNVHEIKYGSVVVIEDDKGVKSSWTIVGSGEVNVLKNTMSFESPLGMAVRGKSVGDSVQVRAPQKKYMVKIIQIK